MRLKLEKYHGLGNDYLVFDPECNRLELTPQRVKLLCNRNVGVQRNFRFPHWSPLPVSWHWPGHPPEYSHQTGLQGRDCICTGPG